MPGDSQTTAAAPPPPTDDSENGTSASGLTDAHYDWVHQFCGIDPREDANQSVDPNAGQPNQSVSIVPPASGAPAGQNPYGGTSLEQPWTQGFKDGFAEPDGSHPPPSPYTPDAQTVYSEGVLAGQDAANGNSTPKQSVGPATGKPDDGSQGVPEDNSTGARFIKVFQKVGEKFGPDVVNKLQSLNVAELIAFAAVFILIEDTPIGWAGMLVGAALIGKELSSVIDDVSAFISITSNPNGDLDAAASHLSDALSRLSIDALIIFLTHKASGAVKPYIKPPTGFVDVLTPEGLIVRVPADKLPENASMSEGSGKGEEPAPRRQAMSNPNKSNLDKWMNVLKIPKNYRQAFGDFLDRIHDDGEIWDIIDRPMEERTQDHPHLEDMNRHERSRLVKSFWDSKPYQDE
jgi:hypothetical protein